MNFFVKKYNITKEACEFVWQEAYDTISEIESIRFRPYIDKISTERIDEILDEFHRLVRFNEKYNRLMAKKE